jgi:hypothetical protein
MKITIPKTDFEPVITAVRNHLALKLKLETKLNEAIELRERISTLIESGKDDDKTVQRLIEARARLDLSPALIEQLESSIAKSRESIKKQMLPHFQQIGQQYADITAAETARLEKILFENISDSVSRAEMLRLGVPCMPAVIAGRVLSGQFCATRMHDYSSSGTDPVNLALELLREFGVTIEEPKQALVPE